VDRFIPREREVFRRTSLSKHCAEKCLKQKPRPVEDVVTDFLCNELFLRKLAISISALCKILIVLDPYGSKLSFPSSVLLLYTPAVRYQI
jgi:hypothetical protein